jgi:hypothetical protein
MLLLLLLLLLQLLLLLFIQWPSPFHNMRVFTIRFVVRAETQAEMPRFVGCTRLHMRL